MKRSRDDSLELERASNATSIAPSRRTKRIRARGVRTYLQLLITTYIGHRGLSDRILRVSVKETPLECEGTIDVDERAIERDDSRER